jgi:ABC-type sugar transport system ATPase subunit
MMTVETRAPVLQIRHVSKRFDTTQALDDVSLDLFPGEIHALMGEIGEGLSVQEIRAIFKAFNVNQTIY